MAEDAPEPGSMNDNDAALSSEGGPVNNNPDASDVADSNGKSNGENESGSQQPTPQNENSDGSSGAGGNGIHHEAMDGEHAEGESVQPVVPATVEPPEGDGTNNTGSEGPAIANSGVPNGHVPEINGHVNGIGHDGDGDSSEGENAESYSGGDGGNRQPEIENEGDLGSGDVGSRGGSKDNGANEAKGVGGGDNGAGRGAGASMSDKDDDDDDDDEFYDSPESPSSPLIDLH